MPDIVKEMDGYHQWADPLLRQEVEEAKDGSRRKLHASLALLPVDPRQVDYLYRRLLDAAPTQVPVIRDALQGHREALTGKLWAVVEKVEKGKEGRRLRAAAALAVYDPESPRWGKNASAVADDLVAVPAVHLASWMDALRPVRGKLLASLSTVFHDGERRETERSLATDLLADYAVDRPEALAHLLMDANERQFAVLYPKVLSHWERTILVLSETVTTPLEPKKSDEEKESLAKRQANAGVALLRLGQAEQVWPLLKHRPDPQARSYLIHRLASLGADPAVLLGRLEQEKEVSMRRALLLALGEFGLPASERGRLVPLVLRLYREEPDAGLHGAAEWLLRQWKQEDKLMEFEQGWVKDKEKRKVRLGQISKELAKDKERGEGYWHVNGQGQTMVVVPGPVTFRMGSPVEEEGREGGPTGRIETPHNKRISRTFAIASHEVTVGQFLKFRKDHRYDKTYSPGDDHPINQVSWFDAAAYCNWLSGQEGVPEKQWCYEPKKGKDVRDWSEEAYGEGMKLKANYLGLEGYRLPSEAEWEAACRAGSLTSRFYGEAEGLLGRYAWYTKVSQDRRLLRVGSLKPNDFGLFDMLGNAHEWCQERIMDYQPKLPWSEDKEDESNIESRFVRVLRGGSFTVFAVNVRSAYRSRIVPTARLFNVGFRPARTFR